MHSEKVLVPILVNEFFKCFWIYFKNDSSTSPEHTGLSTTTHRLPPPLPSPFSSPHITSFPLLSVFLFPAWTFCYLICFPRTSEFATTPLVTLVTIWSVISGPHWLTLVKSRLLLWSTSRHKKPSDTCSPQQPPAWESKGDDAWQRGLTGHLPKCAFHTWTSQWSRFFCLFCFFKFISPAPQNW